MCMPSPKLPKPPSIPRPPTPLSEGVLNARQRERARAQAAAGHQSTILTGPRGIQDGQTSSILGGGGTPSGIAKPTATPDTLGGQPTQLGTDGLTELLKRVRGKKKGVGGGAGVGITGSSGSILGGASSSSSGASTGFAR